MLVEVLTYEADPDRGGFGARVYALVKMLASFADVRVVCTDWFGGQRVPGVEYVHEPFSDSFLSRVRRLRTYYKTDFPSRDPNPRPDVVVVESLDLLGLYRNGPPAPLVLDEHNVYWDLLPYEAERTPFFRSRLGRQRWVRGLLLPHLMKKGEAFEKRALVSADAVLTPSQTDQDTLLREVPGLEGRVHVVPNCVDLDRLPQSGPATSHGPVLLVGNFNYHPNREAADYVLRELGPALPSAQCLLVGKDAPNGAGPPNVKSLGFVEDLYPLLRQAAVCIAPLAHGSGTRLKILTYLAAGKAVVATPKACEGLDVEDEVHLLVRGMGAPFRAAVGELLEDEVFRSALGRAGRRLVETRYDWRVYTERLRRIVEPLAEASRAQGAVDRMEVAA